MYDIFSVFVSVDMLPIGGQDSCRLWYHFSVGCTSYYFYLLMEPSALLAVLHVYFLRWLFIALPIYGVLKIFVKAIDVVAKIL